MDDNLSAYRIAFLGAYKELDELREQEKRLAIRKGQLKDTLSALATLLSDEKFDINSLTLSDAIRRIMASSDRPLSAIEVRGKLADLGFNLAQYDNPLANIHTSLKRMGEAGELTLTEKGDKKKFEASPEMKSTPETFPNTTGAMLEALGLNKEVLSTPGEQVRKTLGQRIADGDLQFPPVQAEEFKPKLGTPDPLNQRGKK